MLNRALSPELVKRIQTDYEEALGFFGELRDGIESNVNSLTGNEQIFMKYLYAYMPLSDAGMYPFETFFNYASHGAFLFTNSKFCKELPEEYFLNYVLACRINSEDITPARPFFYQLVWDRVKDLPLTEAVLEANQWCYEQATYRSTSERTASPLTVYYGGFGRCGEESAFLTAVLRSLGIASRQIYAPRWSHSDSNHAWVEVYAGGRWYYTGACEPKPVLNNGWFPYAASRAMLTLSRLFSKIQIDGEVVEQDGCVAAINRSDLYARNKKITVYVEEEGRPVANAAVSFEIINSSEFFPIARLITDPSGTAAIRLGLGDVRIAVSYGRADGSLVTNCRFISVEDNDIVKFNGAYEEEYGRWIDFNIKAPESHRLYSVDTTPEQERYQEERNKIGDVIRNTRIEAYYEKEFAEQFLDYEGIRTVLQNAKGNFTQIKSFLLQESPLASLQDKSDLLSLIARKDCRDISAETMTDHLDGLRFKGRYPKEIFLKYVYSPGIHIELPTPYCHFILAYFKDRGIEFKHPAEIWNYIEKEIKYHKDREYTTIIAVPKAALLLKSGTPMARNILFVAVCRTYGIPARLDPMYLLPQYYEKDAFHFVSGKEASASLAIEGDAGIEPVYYGNYTLAEKKEDGSYETLRLWRGKSEETQTEVRLLPGSYRLITCERMSSGSITGKMYYFTLAENEHKSIKLLYPGLKAEDFITRAVLPEFYLRDREGNKLSSSRLEDKGKSIFIWTEASKEPTEHIFNELLEIQRNSGFPKCELNFIVKTPEELNDETFQKLLKSFPDGRVLYDDYGDTLSRLCHVTKAEAEKLPFVLVTDGINSGIFACSGYHVGSGDILYKLMKG